MNKTEVMAEIQRRIRRIPSAEARERWCPDRPAKGQPWPDYYLGYRDALGELIEWLEDQGAVDE